MTQVRRATILVVDDEPPVRSLLRRQLERAGYQVLEAASGLHALHLSRLHSGGLDLVLADVVMPLMNGIELAATLCDELPDLPVLLISAYTPAVLTRVGLHQNVVPVLMKPFTSEQLIELVELAINSPVSSKA